MPVILPMPSRTPEARACCAKVGTGFELPEHALGAAAVLHDRPDCVIRGKAGHGSAPVPRGACFRGLDGSPAPQNGRACRAQKFTVRTVCGIMVARYGARWHFTAPHTDPYPASIHTDLVSRNASRCSTPHSRPWPDCFIPPMGTAGSISW